MASLNHGISCPFKVGQEQASVQQQHSPSLPSIAPGVTEKTGAPVPYQLALQMPRHPPQEETIRLVVHPHSITETRRNSSNKRKKSHKTMQPGCLLAIGACSCRGGREGLSPSLSLALMASSSAKCSFGPGTQGERLK